MNGLHRFAPYWRTRQQRWRIALVALTGIVLLLGLRLGSSTLAVSDAQRQLVQIRQTQAEVMQLSERILQQRQLAPSHDQTRSLATEALLGLLTRTSEERGIVLERLQTGGDRRVQVGLAETTYLEVIDWLIALQRDHQVAPDRVSIEASATAGSVNCQLSFKTAATPASEKGHYNA